MKMLCKSKTLLERVLTYCPEFWARKTFWNKYFFSFIHLLIKTLLSAYQMVT